MLILIHSGLVPHSGCQWEALDWQVNGKEVWQKDDWKWLLSQAQSQQIHTGCVKAHGSDQAL